MGSQFIMTQVLARKAKASSRMPQPKHNVDGKRGEVDTGTKKLLSGTWINKSYQRQAVNSEPL
jgi:hypothetical protein